MANVSYLVFSSFFQYHSVFAHCVGMMTYVSLTRYLLQVTALGRYHIESNLAEDFIS